MRQRIGIITFHASHNYGSMLQAYALQKVILEMGHHCEIINFRTKRQKKFYKPLYKQGNIYERLKRFIIQFPYIKQLKKKHILFEEFIKKKLSVTSKEYSTIQELKEANFNYDCYISGSDQIWNSTILDFDWAYFLPFVRNGKRIAYAPSMGPTPNTTIEKDFTAIKVALENYDYISVRETITATHLYRLLQKEVPVVLDPTLLLNTQIWEELAGDTPLIKGDYCFCYSPWLNEEVIDLASKWGNANSIKVIISQPLTYLSSVRAWKNVSTYAAVGPIEFLNLCKYAKMVCCDSFHAVIFSIFFKTPFITLNGMSDSRISNILTITGLQNRSCNKNNFLSVIPHIDFDYAHTAINRKIEESITWLSNVITNE